MQFGVIVLLTLAAGPANFATAAEVPDSLPATYRAFREPGLAMEPTISAGDVVLVDMDYFRKMQPRVGDVVLYRAKSINNGPTVKRIVALEGSRIQLKDAKLFRDDHLLDEPYLKPEGSVTPYSRTWGPIELPAGCIILLGDHRDHSQDSRVDGCSAKEDLLGLARYVSPAAEPAHLKEIK